MSRTPTADFDPVTVCVEEAIAQGATAGASVSVRSLDGVDWSIDRGLAEACPRRRSVVAGQVWDLASLTKVLATATICMKLVDEGRLDLRSERGHLALSEAVYDAAEIRHVRHTQRQAEAVAEVKRLFDVAVNHKLEKLFGPDWEVLVA